jgi:YD repeat-containing protein
MVVDTGSRVGWLAASLTYDSLIAMPAATAVVGESIEAGDAVFGPLWISSLHRRILFEPGLKGARVSRGDGHVTSFTSGGAGVFTAASNVNDRLLSVGSDYWYIDATARAIERYDSAGRILRIDRIDGRSLVYAYSTASTPLIVAPAAGYLLSVTDNFGRSLHFEYSLPPGAPAASGGRVSKVTDVAGQSITPTYDGSGNLSSLTWQDSQTRQFLYENSALTWALTGVIDELAQRYATIGYDAQGRAVSSELAGGVNRYAVSYATPPAFVVTDTYSAADNVVYRVRSWQAPTAAKLVDPYGSTIDLGVSLVADQPSVTTRSQPAGAGCAASTSNVAYDDNGNVAVEDDFNGNRVCRAHDLARNLEVVRVEGLAPSATCSALTAVGATLPAGTRKASTQWHPDWRLETRRAEPRRLTTYVYNGQPDPFDGGAVASCAPGTALLPDGKPIVLLCKTVEQATTDANGSQGFAAVATGTPRITRATYNQYGQVLTTTDARNFTTTYAYYGDTTVDHMPGDLQSVTNAAGHATQYTRYDRAGRLLRVVDSNGLVTDTAYTPRGWLASATVTPTAGPALVTTYTYSPVGLVTQVALPDGTTLAYAYDAAHRLTGITDSAGNTVSYTLDAMGKRTGEQHRDASGTLARNIARAFDALGRLQSVTGATQ